MSVLAAGGGEELGDGAADGAGGEPGAVLGAGRVGAELGAAAEHVLGGLLDVPCGALRGDADLLQFDPHRPAAERGEGGLCVAVGQRPDGGEGVQGPVEEGRERRVRGLDGFRGRLGLRAVGDLAALGAQFRDALFEQVEELLHGDGPGGELKEGEHLGHRGDDLGDGGRFPVRGFGVGQRPGVEEGDPAAQDGAVVAAPRAQPPAGAGAVAVHLDEAGQPGGVPVSADLNRGQPEFGGGPFGGRVGERALAVGSRVVAPGTECGVGPAGDAGRVGQAGACHAGEFRGRRCALRRSRCGARCAALGHRSGSGREAAG